MCEPQMMINPKHPEYEWRFIWDDLLPYQRLSLESLGSRWKSAALMRIPGTNKGSFESACRCLLTYSYSLRSLCAQKNHDVCMLYQFSVCVTYLMAGGI